MIRYQVTFDLHTDKRTEEKLKNKYKKSLSTMYKVINKHFLDNKFSWVEGSVYYSNNKISYKKLLNIFTKLFDDNLWLPLFVRDIKITQINDKTYDYNKILSSFQKEQIENETKIEKQTKDIPYNKIKNIDIEEDNEEDDDEESNKYHQ